MELPRKVYAIQHNVTKKIYIGSSNNPEKRYLAHVNKLKNGKHTVEDMQQDFDEYGEDFSLFIIDEISTYEDRKKEYEWMRKYKTDIRGIGYNYKDQAKKFLHSKYYVPYKEGFPEPLEYKGGWKHERKVFSRNKRKTESMSRHRTTGFDFETSCESGD